MVSVQIDRTECWLEFARTHARLLNLLSFSANSCRAVRLKYSLLSSFFLAHSSLITALWLATSLARNFLSPSVIILILIWLIIGGVANNYAGSGLKLYVRSHSPFNALRNFLAALSPHPRGLYASSFKYFSTSFSS